MRAHSNLGIDLDSSILMIPRGLARTGTTPDGKPGLTWKTKYASVGANGAGLPILLDGLNEKGLATGTFYFPGSAGYMPYTAADSGKTIAQWGGRLIPPRKLRNRCRGQGEYRQHYRCEHRAKSLGLRAGSSLHRS